MFPNRKSINKICLALILQMIILAHKLPLCIVTTVCEGMLTALTPQGLIYGEYGFVDLSI